MEHNTDPQEQAQTNPPPGHSSSATVTDTPCPPPAANTIDLEPGARAEQFNAEIGILSRTFGHIPNIPVFTHWGSRQDCSNSAVHRSIMAGICGNRKNGAYSVALSRSYMDNEDGGDVVIYTGTGGRERFSDSIPPRRIRSGPQTMDQSWEHPHNRVLITSFLNENPVRLIRSWRCPSQYAPLYGYRYDGLYKVTAYWTAKGRNGKDICRCKLERLPGQPPIPLRPVTLPASGRRRKERLIPNFTPTPLPPNSCDTPNEMDTDARPNQPSVSPAQLTRSTGEESEGLQNPPLKRATSETSIGLDFNMGELETDIKYQPPQSPQRQVSPKPDALPRYRWDPRKRELVRVPTDTMQETVDAAERDEEENRVGDDATLVPSEDGHVNERMETEYFSDIGKPGEAHESGSLLLEN